MGVSPLTGTMYETDLPFLASKHTSTILITPFHLTISPLFRPVIPLLILNFLSWRAYSFLNLTLPQQKELIRSLCDLALYSRHFIGFPM